ncbi:MAG: phospholipid/cholesterol/gamma-HCH transport system substrate-binding protein [Planctomycetota bacterium]|jgi:phospholipid/cholesterol/gamma-HCH transport system substrate-binding protein
MHNTRRFRLGLFVLGTGAMFVMLLVFIMQSSFDRERATYYIMFSENVKGMVIGSKVNFQGVPIGVVKDMRFQDGSTLVELSVNPSRASIQDVTRARMDRLLVTGQVSVELEGYAGSGTALPPDSFIEPKEDPMNSLKASLPEVVAQAAQVLERLDHVLGNADALLSDNNQAMVTAILAHAERAARQLADETMPEVGALVADARRTIQAAENTAHAATNSAEAVTATMAAMARLEADLHGLLRESTAIVTGVRGPALATFSGFRSTLDDLRGLLRQLKLAPDSLLFGVNHPAAPVGGKR